MTIIIITMTIIIILSAPLKILRHQCQGHPTRILLHQGWYGEANGYRKYKVMEASQAVMMHCSQTIHRTVKAIISAPVVPIRVYQDSGGQTYGHHAQSHTSNSSRSQLPQASFIAWGCRSFPNQV